MVETVQSVIFDRSVYPNVYRAINRLVRLGFKFHKVDVTENTYRFRQAEPDESKKYATHDYLIISSANGAKKKHYKGIKFVVQY